MPVAAATITIAMREMLTIFHCVAWFGRVTAQPIASKKAMTIAQPCHAIGIHPHPSPGFGPNQIGRASVVVASDTAP